MSRRFSPSAWLAALALLALSMMSAPARSQPAEGAYFSDCFGRFFGTYNCTSSYRGGWRHPHMIGVPSPQSAEERAAADARDRRWANRCRPVTRPDRYGMQRYQYAENGCEFGIQD